MGENGQGPLLDAPSIRSLLFEIGEALASEGKSAEIAVYGGSALLLTLDSRLSTKDLDYTPVAGDVVGLAAAAEEVGARRGLPQGWFNDAVAIFSSGTPDYTLVGDFPPERAGLRVFTATPEYILAMKLMSMRSPFETNDLRDIWDLLDHCGINQADEALAFMAKFYPDDTMPAHKAMILQDVFEARAAGEEYSPMLGWAA